ncbi:serine/arginine repetitive matrix protein 2 [Anopheles funestus]|uniref:serine/arginine repetitive matrix protein 2 n=1 Tax=Anopheles funestus TaxID=62324 RepID=UPI0020C6407A|nr:serine/arginine repetitive matrix protein 2 [Anopheles funestus]
MNRLDELGSTPKKRTLQQDETTVREATTKSGRKVRRPAHLGSPERAPSVSPSEARKSVAVRAKKAVELSAGTPSKRAVTKEQISPVEAKGARKTITRKTISEHLDTPTKNKEKIEKGNTVEDAAGTSKSGRKIKIPTKLMEFESEVLSSPRKHALEDQDVVLKDKLTKTPGRSKTPAKSVAKNIGVEQNPHPDDEENKGLAVRKTPGRRAKSVAPDQLEVDTPKRRAATSLFSKETQKEISTSEQAPPKTPGKRAGKALLDLNVKATPKTPGRRAKSMAPGKEEADDDIHPGKSISETASKTDKKATQTPGRRVGKSMLNVAVTQSFRSENMDSLQAVPKTPGRKPAKAITDTSATTLDVGTPRSQGTANKTPGRRQKSVAVEKSDSVGDVTSVAKADITTAEEPLTRSGRKIKPKKVFDFEQDEKTMDTISTNENVSIDSTRKRKVDDIEEATKSPTKKKIIENVGVETPKLKSRLESNLSLLGTESPQMENPTDGTVSRSGRKIKPKKMFGFDDGVETMTTFVHITGSSPALGEETVVANNREEDISTMNVVPKNTRSGKINPTSTPSKQTTALAGIVERKSSAPPMANDQKVEELVECDENDKQNTFITKRGEDDHHHVTAKKLQRQQHPIDETDRAVIILEPMIIRTSIGFGRPTVQRQTLSEKTDELNEDDRSKVNENSSADTQAAGSSRSGRKIKPKKFFDTDNQTATTRQSVVPPKANQPVPVPKVLSPKKMQVVENQKPEELSITTAVDNVTADEVMHSAEGMDIPEGPVKLVNEATVDNYSGGDGVEQKQQEQVAVAETTDHSDVAMEPMEEDVPDRKVEEDTVGSVTMKETLTAQLVEENMDVPETQHMTLEEEKHNQLPNDNIAEVSNSERAILQHHGEDLALKESSCDTDVKQNSQIENSDAKEDLAHTLADHEEGGNITVDQIVDESNAAIEPPLHDVSLDSAADIKPEEESKVVPTESVFTSNEMANEEMLQEASFGSIEYLEDEMNNVVEHIHKPSHQEPTEEDTKVSAPVIPSIVIAPDTPARFALNETYSPVKPNSSIIDITADTPGPVAPHTPDSKLTAQEANDKCSPDKPPEVIEIMDSPAEAAFCKQINDESAHGGDGGGSATSTPLAVKPSVVQLVNECEDTKQLNVQFESRKRSLSASAADTTMKRNVTFHSPANCTMLVETIDERLMLKSLQDQQQQRHETMETSSKSIGEKLRKPRKRSLSEHKPSEMKRNKTSKLPNFKSIHANHFNRMESLADFMKRKESRAKQILSSCSPATKLLSQPIADGSVSTGVPSVEKKIPSSSTKPFIFKSAGGGIPVPSAGLFTKRTKEGQTVAKSVGLADHHALSAIAAASTAKKPIASNTERMANRLKQFQATFKPKQIGTDTSAVPVSGSLASTSTNVVGVLPVEQLRSKQSKILKGVRTNRRFELQMKHRDNLQHQ